MLSRDQSLRSDRWKLSVTQGNVFGSPRAVIDSSQTPYQGILHSLTQSITVGNPVQKCTGRLVAKGEERIGSTKPMPSFARRPSTMNSFFPAEVPQNSVADQQRLQISELHFDKYPTPSTFSCWKIRMKGQISSCSGFFPRRLCYGSKKWRWSIRWMIEIHRDQFGINFSFPEF